MQAGVVGKTCEVTIIDRSPAHAYTPWLYEVASGILDAQGQKKDHDALFVSASVPFHGIPGYQQVHFRHESVKSVDPARKIVFLEDGLTIAYDTLVVALGSEVNYFGIPGFPEHCFPLKSASDAIAIERRASEIMKGAMKHDRRNIVIVGGGPTGVELAGEIMGAVTRLERMEQLIRGTVRVSLVDRLAPLSVFPKAMSRIAVKRLKKIGVHVLSGFSVMEARPKMLVLKEKDGSIADLPCDLCVWAGGVTPGKVSRDMVFPHDEKGRILVEPTFAVKDADHVYAAGDCIAFCNPLTNTLEPMTAQSAIGQGRWIAVNILRDLKGLPLKPFPFRKRWDVLIALSGKFGVGNIRGITFSGPLAFYLRRFVDFRYFFHILPWPMALKKWLRGVIIYDKNDA